MLHQKRLNMLDVVFKKNYYPFLYFYENFFLFHYVIKDKDNNKITKNWFYSFFFNSYENRI